MKELKHIILDNQEEILISFLKKKGCFQQYLFNLENRHTYFIQKYDLSEDYKQAYQPYFNHFIKTTCVFYLFSCAFLWEETEEGFNFWYKLAEEFQKELQKLGVQKEFIIH